MIVRVAFFLATLAASAVAQLKILAPGGQNLWWVANSENNIVWTCQTSPYSNFTVLISNSNPSILVSPLAVVAQQNNFDCSRTLTTQQVNFMVGTGYKVSFANPLNNTQVYAETEEFEIKPVGSAYPDASATPSAGPSATASGSGSAAGTGSASEATSSGSGALQLAPSAFSSLFAGAFALLAL